MTYLKKINRIIYFILLVLFSLVMVFQTSLPSSGRIEASAIPYNEESIIDIVRHEKFEAGINYNLKSDYSFASNLRINDFLMNTLKEKIDEKNKTTYNNNSADDIIYFNSNNDHSLLEIVESDPARWSTNVATNQTFTITYNKPIEVRDLREIYFYDWDTFDKTYTNVTTSGNELYITPLSDLEPYTQYMINIDLLSITDFDGNTPERNEFWSFHTGAEVPKVSLSALTVNPGNLKPFFASETTEYTVEVSHEVSSIDINATLSNESNSLTINGDSAKSGESFSVELKSAGSETVIDIVVTGDELSKAYQVTVYRSEFREPIVLGDVNFDGVIDVQDMTLVVQQILSLTTLNEDQKTAADVNQDKEIDVHDAALIMQYVFGLIESFDESYPGIEPGPEDVTLNASVAEGVVGETVSVEISVEHARGSIGGQLALTFDPDIVRPVDIDRGSYFEDVQNSQFISNLVLSEDQLKLLWITPEGDTDDSGVVCEVAFELLSQGESNIFFSDVVISPAAFNVDTYNPGVIIVHSLDDNADLRNLTISEGTLEPSFDPNRLRYTAELAHDIDAVDITATLSDRRAAMTIDGEAATSGEAVTIILEEDGTTREIEIVVTASDGETQKTYVIDLVSETKIIPVEAVVLTAEPANWQYTGEPVTFTAEVMEGNEDAEFRFYYRTDGGSWKSGTDYSTENTWTASTSYVGEVQVGVIARAVGSDVFEETRHSIDYTIEEDLGEIPITAISSIVGEAKVGSELKAGILTPAEATAVYQWVRANEADGRYEIIAGATSSSYSPVGGDAGFYVKVEATGIGYYIGTVKSASIGPVVMPEE